MRTAQATQSMRLPLCHCTPEPTSQRNFNNCLVRGSYRSLPCVTRVVDSAQSPKARTWFRMPVKFEWARQQICEGRCAAAAVHAHSTGDTVHEVASLPSHAGAYEPAQLQQLPR